MRSLLLSGWFAALIGCAGEIPSQPTRGSLFINDKPAAGAVLVFHPTSGDPKAKSPTGLADSQGGFQLSTINTHDGAPVGDYNVTVIWPRGTPDGEIESDQLMGKFGDPKRPAARITIRRGENVLEPIRIK